MAFRNTLLLAAILAAPGAQANEFRLGDLVIDHPHSYATPPMARSGAGYMTLTNMGVADDVLLSATAGFAEAQIHTTTSGADGVMRMVEQEAGVPIPAGGTVEFAPGGFHVMFMGLEAPFVTGTSNAVTLTFEKAGEITVDFVVEDRPAAGDQGHGH